MTPVATVQVIGGAPPASGPAHLDYHQGDRVRLRIDSDATVGLELLGYGIARTVAAGTPAADRLRRLEARQFPADRRGISHRGRADSRGRLGTATCTIPGAMRPLARPTQTARAAALLPLGALAVHELRYALAYGSGARDALASPGPRLPRRADSCACGARAQRASGPARGRGDRAHRRLRPASPHPARGARLRGRAARDLLRPGAVGGGGLRRPRRVALRRSSAWGLARNPAFARARFPRRDREPATRRRRARPGTQSRPAPHAPRARGSPGSPGRVLGPRASPRSPSPSASPAAHRPLPPAPDQAAGPRPRLVCDRREPSWPAHGRS